MHKVEVAFRDESLDSVGISTKNSVSEDLGIQGISRVRYSEVYYVESNTGLNIEEIAKNVLSDPIIQDYSIDSNLFTDYDYVIEVKLHPDVTDNLAIVIGEAISDYVGKKFGGKISTSRRYYTSGSISIEGAQRIAKELLANEVVETFTVEAKK